LEEVISIAYVMVISNFQFVFMNFYDV
jgi:hypothetical protein